MTICSSRRMSGMRLTGLIHAVFMAQHQHNPLRGGVVRVATSLTRCVATFYLERKEVSHECFTI